MTDKKTFIENTDTSPVSYEVSEISKEGLMNDGLISRMELANIMSKNSIRLAIVSLVSDKTKMYDSMDFEELLMYIKSLAALQNVGITT